MSDKTSKPATPPIRLEFTHPLGGRASFSFEEVEPHRPKLSREGVIAYPHPAGAAELRRPEPVFDESTVEAFVGLPVTWTEGEP